MADVPDSLVFIVILRAVTLWNQRILRRPN